MKKKPEQNQQLNYRRSHHAPHSSSLSYKPSKSNNNMLRLSSPFSLTVSSSLRFLLIIIALLLFMCWWWGFSLDEIGRRQEREDGCGSKWINGWMERRKWRRRCDEIERSNESTCHTKCIYTTPRQIPNVPSDQKRQREKEGMSQSKNVFLYCLIQNSWVFHFFYYIWRKWQ